MRLILHSSDWHLGKNRKFDDYLQQQAMMISGIISQIITACKDNPSAEVWFILAGDVFDRNQDTRREEFVLFLTAFIKPVLELLSAFSNLKVFVIDGNHDRQPKTEEPSVLTPLQTFFGSSLRLSVVEPHYHEDVELLALPFGGYSTKDLINFCQQYNPVYVVAHECLSRMQTDTGWTPPRDQDHYIEIDDVLPNQPKIQGVFLGDIHRSQSLDQNQLCWYSGSPVTLDHGHKPPKGILHHWYIKENGLWKKVRDKTELVPLSISGIKTHFQLGNIETVEDIPWERIYQSGESYLSLVVTPEVHRKIAEEVPDFFANPQVSFSFQRELETEITPASSVHATTLDQSYYTKAIREWTEINLPHLSSSLKDEFVGRAEKLFEERG